MPKFLVAFSIAEVAFSDGGKAFTDLLTDDGECFSDNTVNYSHCALHALQHRAEMHEEQTVALGSDRRRHWPARTKTALFDCQAYPKLCQEPFNCQKRDSLQLKDFTQSGKPSLGTWCLSPSYQDYIHQCIVQHDLIGAAHTQFAHTAAGRHGKHTLELDASYCFIDGHCLNEAVDKHTTLEEATKMCNERFGDKWTLATSMQSLVVHDLPFVATADLSNGFKTRQQTEGYLMAACKMGNYHCDVMYCKETYCKNPYFIKKYSHFLDDFGWRHSSASFQKKRS